MKRSSIWILLISVSLPMMARAQEAAAGDADELNIIELELEKGKQVAPPPAPPAPSAAASGTKEDVTPETKPMDFSGLGKLSSFSEVSVLQKRFLPKTGRFELFGGLSTMTNNPFFNTYGYALKGSYFFRESFGVELNYFSYSTTEAKSTTELKNIQGVTTGSLITTSSFKGVDAMFVPIYGKMTWFNHRIIPFDLYFSTGYGLTTTQNDSGTKDQGTLHLGTGQIFALSKATAVRWDFSWNFFNAVGVDQKSSAYNNLFLTVGLGWFFPEAKYR